MGKLTGILKTFTKNNYGEIISHSKKYIEKPFDISLAEGQTYKTLFDGVACKEYKANLDDPAIILSNGKELDLNHVDRVIEVNKIKFFELENNEKTRQFYVDYLTIAKSTNEHGEYVLLRNPEEYKGSKLFIGEHGCGGTVIEKDGHIVSLAKNQHICQKMKYKGVGEVLTLISIAKGGNKIECWKGFLTEFYIKRFGFVPVTSIPFDVDPYAGQIEWNYKRDGKPDIVFIGHNGDGLDKIIKTKGMYPGISTYNVKHAKSFDKANDILNNVVDNKKVSEYQHKKILNKSGYSLI